MMGLALSIPEGKEYDPIKAAADVADLMEHHRKRLDRAIELYDLEQQGRLVVLPCKVGDTVFSKDGKAAEVEEFWVDKFNLAAQVFFQCDYNCGNCAFSSWSTGYDGDQSCDGEYGNALVPVSQIGKTVFLTREEAEAALRGDGSGET